MLQGAIDKGFTDPNDPMIRMESSYMELNNMRVAKSVGATYPSLSKALKAEWSYPMLSMQSTLNHTAEHCHLTPKCLKCGNKHQTRDCCDQEAGYPLLHQLPSSRPHGQL
ncbi:hypothetical protein TNCV_5130981, partial [Trichonephila clavipes]